MKILIQLENEKETKKYIETKNYQSIHSIIEQYLKEAGQEVKKK